MMETPQVALPAGLSASPWLRFTVRRLGQLLLSALVLITASFLIIHLVPGDPVRAALGLNASQQLVDARRAQLGLNDPLWLQYVHYLRNLFTGQFGTSITSGLPVSQVIGQRLPATLALAGYSFLVAIAVAVPLGLTLGVLTRGGRRRGTELAFTSVSILLATIPGFLLSVGLVYVFGVTLRTGCRSCDTQSGFPSYILPIASLAIGPAVVLARILRIEVRSALRADYVRTARAKRLPAWRVYLLHVLPNALTATLTICGLLLAALIAGTVLVENVFAWPGLGSTIVTSIIAKDYPVVQGIVLVYGTGVLLINLIVDIALALLDPQVDNQGELMASSYLPGGQPAVPAGGRSRRAGRFRRALLTPVGTSAAVLLAVVLLLAVFAPVLWSSDASAIDTFNILQGPSAKHWLGTNNLGQDVFYRVLVATRLSVGLALAATAIGVACGLVLGTAPLVAGRRAGRAVTSVINVAVAFPALLLALFFAVIFGVGARGALLAIGFASVPAFARLVRTLSASVAGLDYIAAARIAGVSRFRLLTRHVLPNIGEPLIVNATIAAGDALLAFAGLSFLGLGVQPPAYDWGQLLNDGLQGIYTKARPRRSPPASPSSSRASRSTSSARPWRL